MSGTLQVGGITLGTHNSGTGKVDITNAGTVNATATTVTTLNTTSIASGAIGSNVTIADGASPHGWEHIKTIHYNNATATPLDMANVVSSKYSMYKLFCQWGSVTSNKHLYFRFLDASGAEHSLNRYEYGFQLTSETAAEGASVNGQQQTAAQLSRSSIQGARGFNAELLFFNCYASTSSYPTIDGNILGAGNREPHCVYQHTGHMYGAYDMGAHGFFWYDSPIDVTGFRMNWAGNTNVSAGSFWSCYGLKLPTAD